jgi:Leucine-rich repeat (LRR) protein
MIRLNIPSNEEVLTQSDIDIFSSYSNLQELELVRFDDIKDINLESLYIPKLIFFDLKYSTHGKVNRFRNNIFPTEVLKTIKNVNAIELNGFQITQDTLDTLSTLTSVKEMNIPDSGFDENLDFSVLKKAKNLTSFTIGHYSKAQSLDGFPESICNIKQLKKLIYNCEISTVPKCIGNLKKLEYLDFYENELIELPNEIGQLTKLKYLNLEYCEVTNFNTAICKLTKLETLNLGYNEIVKIPSCIGNLTKLKFRFKW